MVAILAALLFVVIWYMRTGEVPVINLEQVKPWIRNTLAFFVFCNFFTFSGANYIIWCFLPASRACAVRL